MEYFAVTEKDAKTAEEGIKTTIEKTIEKKLPNHDFGENNVTNIFNTAYAFAGIVAVAFIVYGGVQYITANGDPGKITKAKRTILYAVIGLVVVLLAAAITFFVTQSIAGAGA